MRLALLSTLLSFNLLTLASPHRNNQVIVDLKGRFINVELSCQGSTHDTKVWYYSTVCRNKKAHFSPGEFILGDPGYLMDDPNIKVPASADDCKGDPLKAHVADIHRRHRFVVGWSGFITRQVVPMSLILGILNPCWRLDPPYFVVEYAIGSAKRYFPTAGCPGGACYLKRSEYQGVAWMIACGLTNHIWDSRKSWLRGEKYFAGQWEYWEESYMLKKFEKGLFYSHPTSFSPGDGVTSRCFGREDY